MSMKHSLKLTSWGLLATFALTAAAPVLAAPSSQQKNKNTWRNLGIAGAAVAGYGLLKHNSTATLLGAAGAAYSANRYETDRRHQSQDTSNRRRYYRVDRTSPAPDGGYYRNNGSERYDTNRNDTNRNDNNRRNTNRNDTNRRDDNRDDTDRRDNGRHLGWYKHDSHDRGRD